MADLFVQRTAEWSGETHPLYRWVLRIIWDDSLPMLVALLANPSKASEHVSDPTVDRVEGRGRRLGFGGAIILNAFGYRATDPNDMRAASDPVGPHNDRWLRRVLAEAKENGWTVMAGWGSIGEHLDRHRQIAVILEEIGVQAVCLGVTRGGQPLHPLYQKNDAPFQPWPKAA